MESVLIILACGGITLLAGGVLNRWWGGFLTWPIPVVVVAVLVARDNSNFLPGIFFAPMVAGGAALTVVVGGMPAAAILLIGRAPDGQRLTPDIRRAATFGGLAITAGCAAMWLLDVL